MNATCLACELTSGDRELPGGRIRQTRYWLVEHCVGPLGVGTLVVKPFRHCVHIGALTLPEAVDLGPLLAQAARCVQELTNAEQVYVCLWSHAGWSPQHIHFIVQPSWAHLERRYSGPGPTLQAEQFEANMLPSQSEVEAFCVQAREWPGWAA
jgi:diadenosine tetraphosphate (Ap4A) HIT family hydrolase